MNGPAEVPVAETAPAKVNLSLRVVGRRDDGYHLLDSLVAFADVGDRLTAEPAEGLSLDIVGPHAAALADTDPDDNLVLRAARAVQELAGVSHGARITLDKRLPVAGGIGGGSADAAAAIRALMRLWGVTPVRAELMRLALDLGADVPVCLDSAPRRMAGIGEVLVPLPSLPDDPSPGLLLVNPLRETPTGAVFRALSGRFDDPPALPATLGPTARDLAAALSPLGNTLTEAACRVTPAVAEVLDVLQALPGVRYAAMSGSGATCFALFDDAGAASRAAADAALGSGGWWVVPTSLRPV